MLWSLSGSSSSGLGTTATDLRVGRPLSVFSELLRHKTSKGDLAPFLKEFLAFLSLSLGKFYRAQLNWIRPFLILQVTQRLCTHNTRFNLSPARPFPLLRSSHQVCSRTDASSWRGPPAVANISYKSPRGTKTSVLPRCGTPGSVSC